MCLRQTKQQQRRRRANVGVRGSLIEGGKTKEGGLEPAEKAETSHVNVLLKWFVNKLCQKMIIRERESSQTFQNKWFTTRSCDSREKGGIELRGI